MCIFIWKTGQGKKLLMKLREAEEAVKDGNGWLDPDKLKSLLEK